MNADRLLAHFDTVVDTPGAVPRLRRFILDLAVRGKLVPQEPQDSNDEPASALLSRIAIEKRRLADAGEIRQKPRWEASSRADMPFSLPADWVWSRVAEIGVLNPRNTAPDDSQASFVPMSMIASEYGVPHRHEVKRWAEIKSGYTHFAEGDVGVAKITPCFENGKSTIFRNLAGGMGSGTTELHVVRPLFVDPRYVVLYFKSSYFIEPGIPKMTGTAGQKRVPATYWANAPFPLPPLPEQHRIVAKVDELMTLCDQMKDARQHREAARDRFTATSPARLSAPDRPTFRAHAVFTINNLDRLTARSDQISALRRTIIDLAVRGRLVPQDPTDEPAQELLGRIAEKRDSPTKIGTMRKATTGELTMVRAPFSIPDTWRWAAIGDVFAYDVGIKRESSAMDPSLWLLELQDVEKNTGSLLARVTAAERESKSTKSEFCTGDILYGKLRPYLNKVLVADDRGYSTTEIVALRPYLPLCARYCALALRRRDFVDYVTQVGQGTKMPRLRRKDAIVAPFPLPPLAEQHRIVARADELMTLCDRLEEMLVTTEDTRRGLLDAVLREALELGRPFMRRHCSQQAVDYDHGRRRRLDYRPAPGRSLLTAMHSISDPTMRAL